MSHKFTDGDKWEDDWFAELSQLHKLIFLYLCDRCDCAGFWKISLRHLQYHVGAGPEDWKAFIASAGEKRIQFINDELIWLVKYIPFQQCRGFTPENNVVKGIARRVEHHRPPLELLPRHYRLVLEGMISENHNLPKAPTKTLEAPTKTLEGVKDKDKDTVKVKAQAQAIGVAVRKISGRK